MPNQSNNISLPVSMTGVIQRMDPLTNLQVPLLHVADGVFLSVSFTCGRHAGDKLPLCPLYYMDRARLIDDEYNDISCRPSCCDCS